MQLRNKNEFFDLGTRDSNGPAELRQIIMVCTTDLFDHSMNAKTFENAGDLRARFGREAFTDCLVGNAPDGVFAARASMRA